MTDVNTYYLGSLEQIFGTELESGLITYQEAQELCAKKYIQPHITNENLIMAPLTEEELGAVLLQFPDYVQGPVPLHALSPMVQRMSDPDGMGATPTHQSDTHEADTDNWGPKTGSAGEIPLPVPFRDPNNNKKRHQEGLFNVEGRAVRKSHCQEKRQDSSTGSTAPVSTPATHSPWSCTTSHMSKDIYPAEHPFIWNLKDSDNLEETPYAATTTGFPLYKGSYIMRHSEVPLGFMQNDRSHFILFPIKGPDGDVRQVEYVQVILHPNPIIIGLQEDSDKVYTKPLYTAPLFHYDRKPMYKAQQLEKLKKDVEGQEQMDHMICRLGNPSLAAEVHRFCMVSQEIE